MAPKYNRKKPVQHQPKPGSGNSKKTLYIIVGVLAIVLIIAGAYFAGGFGLNNANPQTSPTPTATATPTAAPNPTPATNNTKVVLQTNFGNITLQLFDNKPITTKNFLTLVAQSKYDGTVFHRIIDGFMIQGGTINENIPTINDEIGTYNRNLPYTIAMAKTSQPNSATSSFFINTVDNGANVIDNEGHTFDQTYTAFGKVIAGQNVVDAISKVPVTQSPYNPQEYSVPTQTVTLISATIIS
jgi:cyclophilin family peptidyl-prolyl cis-trans isomerase